MPTSRSMRALVLERHNGPFILTEAELPVVTVDQVPVRIKASGVNPLDTKIRTGNAAHARVELPAILGMDLASVVEAVGPDVTTFKPGDEVYGMAGGVGGLQGTLATFAAVDADGGGTSVTLGGGPSRKENSMTVNRGRGIVDTPSNHSADETVEKLKEILQARGVTLFALVDHSREAEKAGMKMPPTKLLIFGNPKAGTPVMLAAPSSAIDLPLKILVWEDAQGKVWVTYNSPTYLQERHSLPPELLQNIAVVETLATKPAE